MTSTQATRTGGKNIDAGKTNAQSTASPMTSLETFSDEQLKGMKKMISALQLARRDAKVAAMPKLNEQVKVLKKGKYAGKLGTVEFARNTRVYVKVPGIGSSLYLLGTEVERVGEGKPSLATAS